MSTSIIRINCYTSITVNRTALFYVSIIIVHHFRMQKNAAQKLNRKSALSCVCVAIQIRYETRIRTNAPLKVRRETARARSALVPMAGLEPAQLALPDFEFSVDIHFTSLHVTSNHFSSLRNHAISSIQNDQISKMAVQRGFKNASKMPLKRYFRQKVGRNGFSVDFGRKLFC